MFERLLAVYGAQRMTAAWGDVPADERRTVWGGAIARAVWSPAAERFDLESVGAALDEIADAPSSWPPSSGEFADICARYAQRPARNLRALPVPRRTEAELARGREHMDRLKALLKRPARAAASREPGSDGEPVPPTPAPACTCWTGAVRAPTLCSACEAFRRGPVQHAESVEAMRSA